MLDAAAGKDAQGELEGAVREGSIADRVYAQERKASRAMHRLALIFFGALLIFCAVAWREGDSFFLRLATEALIMGGLALSVDILLRIRGSAKPGASSLPWARRLCLRPRDERRAAVILACAWCERRNRAPDGSRRWHHREQSPGACTSP